MSGAAARFVRANPPDTEHLFSLSTVRRSASGLILIFVINSWRAEEARQGLMVKAINFKYLSAMSGALALLGSVSCWTDDATVVDQDELDLDPAPATDSPSTGAPPSTTGSGSGV